MEKMTKPNSSSLTVVVEPDLDEKSDVLPPSPSRFKVSVELPAGVSPAVDEKKLLRKIDLHVMPWLCLLYFFNILDRAAIGAASCTSVG